MPRALLLSVRFHDGRFHGRPEWPPSPARLFQALVAGAANGAALDHPDVDALAWLESLDPPVIAAPSGRATKGFTNYVPNNDLDAVSGDLRRVAEIRAAKLIKSVLFEADLPLLYVWHFDGDTGHAEQVRDIADRLYQLGRGVDMAWAAGEVGEKDEAKARLESYAGVLYCPCTSGEGCMLACPAPGSLKSLIDRHKKNRTRFSIVTAPAPTKADPSRIKVIGQTFSQPPKPRFRQVAYNSPPQRLLFELGETAGQGGFYAWPFTNIVRLVETVRDGAARALCDALCNALPDQCAVVMRVFIGRDSTEADKAQRIRILPLPSIGHVHADHAIRRLLVEVPPDCPVNARDIAWAFTAWQPHDRETGELYGWQLVEISEEAGELYTKMPGHYGINGRNLFRLWRTATPAVLPLHAERRHIDPNRIREEAKGGSERLAEEARAIAAVRHALRHVSINTPVEAIRVQREPFDARGTRAEAFADGTRFSKHRLWHVEITFAVPCQGPIVIGDGRYIGLGIMAPEATAFCKAFVFAIEHPLPLVRDRPDVLTALRRALMALDRDGDTGRVSTLFSGHEPDGSPAGDGVHRHVFLAADADENGCTLDRLYVIRPDAADRRARISLEEIACFERVTTRLRQLRVGKTGVISLCCSSVLTAGDPLFGPARTWESRTAYSPTRHASRRKDPGLAVIQDVIMECERRGLPKPEAELLELTVGPKGGHPVARLRICFPVAVEGPIMLGRDSHSGGGLFAAAC